MWRVTSLDSRAFHFAIDVLGLPVGQLSGQRTMKIPDDMHLMKFKVCLQELTTFGTNHLEKQLD